MVKRGITIPFYREYIQIWAANSMGMAMLSKIPTEEGMFFI